METVNTDMLRGRVDIFVLKALSENDGYGYDILNYIHSRTEGHYEMKQSSIYSVLKRLEKQGYVYSYNGDETNGAKRRYYSLTEAGRKMLDDEEKEWAYTRTLLDNLVSDRNFDLKTDTPPFRPSDLRPLTRRGPRSEDSDQSEQENNSLKQVESDNDSVKTEKTEITVNVYPITENVTVKEEVKEIKSETSDSEQVLISETSLPVEGNSAVQESASVLPTEDTSFTDISDNRDDIVQSSEKSITTEEISKVAATTDTAENLYVPFSPSQEKRLNESITPSKVSIEEKSSEKVLYNRPVTEKAKVYTSGFSNNGESYIDFFSNLFNEKKPEEKPSVSRNEKADNIDCSHINDLRTVLDKEGIRLRNYEPINAGKTSIKYVLVNKIFRDSIVLSYLFTVLSMLIVYFVKDFGVSLNALLIVCGIMLIFPIVALFVCFNNPLKRKKDNLRPKIVLSICLIIYLAYFIVNLIINLLIPNGNSLNSPATYAPAVAGLVIPFFGCIFALLYKTGNYHLKNK